MKQGVSGMFNLVTGNTESFNDIAKAVIKLHCKGQVQVETISFQGNLKGAHQEMTQADLTKQRAAGCDHKFRGVAQYMALVNK